MKSISYKSTLLCLLLATIAACSSDNNTAQESNFDRQVFLAFMLNEQILPTVENLQLKASALNETVATFSLESSPSEIDLAREQWLALADAWQYMHIFDFGASELTTGNLGEEIATFPISESKMLGYVQNNDLLFQNFDRDSRGIYAIEFFLFSENADLKNDQQLAYLKALTNRVKQQSTAVQQNWNTTGKEDFLAQNGTDAGSSLSNLVNAMAKSFEAIKNFKLGVPLGLRPGQITAEPTRVEAYFSDKSLQLMKTHFTAITNIWKGQANFSNRTGLGFEEYLESVFGGEELKVATLAAINEIDAQFITIDTSSSLTNKITNDAESVVVLHNLFQRHTRFFKSDLASLLGVSITFNSGDGD